MSSPLALILAGGTGGHVYPALAVAHELRKREISLIWFGLEDKIEARVAKDENIEFYALRGTGIRGKQLMAKIIGSFKIARDCFHMYLWIGRNKPQVAVGFGGYSSLAAGIACWLQGIPLVIQEQNARAGGSNKLLSRLAQTICLGYQGSIVRGKNIVVTGNPVRETFQSIKPSQPSGPLHILVLGGSLGASNINRSVAEAIATIDMPYGIDLVHQCGDKHYKSTMDIYNKHNHNRSDINIYVQAFLDPVIEYYVNCDLVICRAGAMTLAELAMCSLPALLIPYPHAIDDHQTENAKVFVSSGSGWLLADDECTADNIGKWLQPWLQQKPQQARQKIKKYSRSLSIVSRPDATKNIAELVMQEIYK